MGTGAGIGAPCGDEPFLLQTSDSDERSHHQAVMEAMQVIGFRAEEVGSVHRILAAILHLVSLAARLGATARVLSPPTRGGGGWPLTAQPLSWPRLRLLKLSRFCSVGSLETGPRTWLARPTRSPERGWPGRQGAQTVSGG